MQTSPSAQPNRRRTLRRGLVAAGIAMLLLPVLVLAQGRGGLQGPRGAGFFGGPFQGRILERIADRLELTEAQRAEVKGLIAGHREELRQEVDAVIDARRQLFDTIHAESFDEAAIRAASSAAATAQADLAVTRGEIVQELRAVLTPEQRQEAKQLREDFRALLEDRVDFWRQQAEATAF